MEKIMIIIAINCSPSTAARENFEYPERKISSSAWFGRTVNPSTIFIQRASFMPRTFETYNNPTTSRSHIFARMQEYYAKAQEAKRQREQIINHLFEQLFKLLQETPSTSRSSKPTVPPASNSSKAKEQLPSAPKMPTAAPTPKVASTRKDPLKLLPEEVQKDERFMKSEPFCKLFTRYEKTENKSEDISAEDANKVMKEIFGGDDLKAIQRQCKKLSLLLHPDKLVNFEQKTQKELGDVYKFLLKYSHKAFG